MAETLPNGVIVPNADGKETISTTGVAELRTTGASIDTLLAGKASLEQLSALTPLLFSRGKIPAGTNLDTWVTDTQNGFWTASAAAAQTFTGLPDDTQSQPFDLLMLGASTRVSTQIYFPYGANSTVPRIRSVANITDRTWTPWAEIGGGGGAGDGTEGAWSANAAQLARFIASMGGPIDTGGLAAVAIRCDHGLANFGSKVLPLTKARGMKVSMAYNPRNWDYPENAGVTATDLNGWVEAGDVEIWNHSASHAPADTEKDLYDQIVNGLKEIEEQLPAAKGQVWGWNPPGVSSGDYGGYDGGKTPAGWDTYAGRLILGYHAVASGSLADTQLHPLDGVPRPGLARYQMDTQTVAAIKAKIDEAITARKGLQLMLHPSVLDTSGYLTTAQLTEVLDYLVTRRDAAELVTLSPYELTIADASRLPVGVDDVAGLDERLTVLEQDTGDLNVTATVPGLTAGTWTLRREGKWVYMNLYDVALTATAGTYWQQPGWIPSGFRPPAASQYVHFPTAVRNANFTSGPLRMDRYGGVTIYDITSKQVAITASWITNDDFPTTWPGNQVLPAYLRGGFEVDPVTGDPVRDIG